METGNKPTHYIMSGKQKFNIKDKALEKKEFAKYRLSIELSLSGFSYCILDSSSNTFIAFENFQLKNVASEQDLLDEIKQLIKKNDLLQQSFKDTNVLYVGFKSTLIPADLFDASKLDNYLKFNYQVHSDEIVLSQNLFNLKAFNVYSIPSKLKTGIENVFKNAKIGHYSGGLIENLLFQNTEKESNVYIHVQDKHFDLLSIKGKTLNFYNHFIYQTPEDFVYYTMFTINQMKISTDKQTVIILGEIDKQSEEIKLLTKYLPQTRYGLRNETFRYSPLFEEMPKHYYYNLLNFHL